MPRRTATKSKPVEEEVEDELELDDEDGEDELTELDEDEESETPTRSKKGGRRDDEVTFGVRHLCDHLAKMTGKTYTPRDVRILLRKLARNGQIDREITQGNRTRYDWPKGLEDPEVKKVIKAVKGGQIEEGKKEALDALKARKAAGEIGQKTTKSSKATKSKAKAKAKPPVEEEEFDDEDFEDEDED